MAVVLLAAVVCGGRASAQFMPNPEVEALLRENARLREEVFRLRLELNRRHLSKRVVEHAQEKPDPRDETQEVPDPDDVEEQLEAFTEERIVDHASADHSTANPRPEARKTEELGDEAVVEAEELIEPKKPKARWSTRVAVGGNLTGGNVDSYRVNGDLRSTRQSEKHRTSLVLNGDVGQSEGRQTSERMFSSADHRSDFTPYWFTTFGGGYQRNPLAGLDHHVRGSIGIGYYFFKSERVEWALDVGPAYVFEQRAGFDDSHRPSARLGQEFEIRIHDHLKFFQNAEVLTSINNGSYWRLHSEAGIETDITRNLSLRFTGRNRYDAQPSAERRNNDFTLGASMVIRLE
ncbi:DUF481 domain-containing protein [Sulfuriroseicoccus oceanibius]|uniref:DUF481 domain-containing protein n=1 Tax=Sulfuriroseicoccus oceanibius TaxID=2707525 RepID=A0A6B3LGM0_9BACT|nr:DUF481 domain-containing protein [Sulfuriroseicoccus oceanibius]QQL45443.1 DUF481 domain-containing protein [Sulfuriroseicoccus oceanibius]